MPVDKNGKYNLNPMAMDRDEAKPEAQPSTPAPKEDAAPTGDKVTATISKKPEGGYKSVVDSGDELGPDENDHGSLAEAHAALAEQLEAKFGEKAVEDAEEEIAPGIHEQVADKLEGGDKESGLLAGLKR